MSSPGDRAGESTRVELMDIRYTQLLLSAVSYLQNKIHAFSIGCCTDTL